MDCLVGLLVIVTRYAAPNGAFRLYADKDKIREAVNDWIRHSGAFDGVIDFDLVARDPNRPPHILAKYDSGDHLHPQDDGYKAMADSIDLKMLSTQP
jgi:lysophospholipase L1-like esterase